MRAEHPEFNDSMQSFTLAETFKSAPMPTTIAVLFFCRFSLLCCLLAGRRFICDWLMCGRYLYLLFSDKADSRVEQIVDASFFTTEVCMWMYAM